LLLPYVRNQLSSESTRALLCVGEWSRRSIVRDSDIKAAAILPNVNGEEPPLASGWDNVVTRVNAPCMLRAGRFKFELVCYSVVP
jgi:hypothetical protein